MPHSTLKFAVANVLKSEGFIDDVRESEGEGPKTLTLVLRYGKSTRHDKDSAIDGVRRVSAPGRRVYVRFDRIPRVRSGMGISILSTSRGVMADRTAREQRVGGELLCEVW
jgi:small subunit ribosomal protein S8